jgi:Xaa-Pro aminopeptidase
VHEASARAIAEGLHDLNILLLPPEEALSTGAIGVFFPHGVGHLVGLRVRDVGCEENRNPKKYFGAFLRVDLDLEEGHMLTVEPGCYFIPALIDDPQIRTTHKQHLNWSELDKWRGFGGVRIEDDIVIRSKGPEILTGDIPRQ